MSRFMLNLRQAAEQPIIGSPLGSTFYATTANRGGDTGHFSSVRFNHDIIIGNMGESLRFGDEDFDEMGSESTASNCIVDSGNMPEVDVISGDSATEITEVLREGCYGG